MEIWMKILMWHHFTSTELTTLKNYMSHYGSISKVCLLLLLVETETIHRFKEITSKVTRIERDTWTPMFTAALSTIARTWKPPRCPSADEWIRKLWYTYTMEYYSAIKKNVSESVLMRWMKLEPIILSEVSQKENIDTVY